MPHTPLATALRRVASAAHESTIRNVDAERVLDERAAASTRRDFLRRAGAGALGLALSPAAFAKAKAGGTPARIAVIGGGLAGLTCAYRLKQAGFAATVYEANTRLGGRCWTDSTAFLDGQIIERGGELIDQGHTAIRQLAQEFKLPLDNLLAAEANGSEPFFNFDGSDYSYAEATRDLKAIWQTIHRDVSEAPFPTLYNSSTERGRQLDRLSIIDYINQVVPGGRSSRLGQLLDVAYNIEYGAECENQSALNLLYLLGYNSPGQFSIFGESNEKYHVRGGNEQIVTRLASALGPQVVTGSALVAVRRNADGTYTLTLSSGNRTRTVTADKVVFALPFTILRTSVDFSRAGFSPIKTIAIREQPMGSNSKLHLQFHSRPWEALGCNGDTYSDAGYQVTWDVTRAQPGASGILVNYTGGAYANTFASGTPISRAQQFLGQVEPVLPGLSARWNGRATVDYWQGNPFTRGSYAYYAPGNYSRFVGAEGAQDGNAHFCGEHTSIDSQGYLNGAVESGERVANEIARDLA